VRIYSCSVSALGGFNFILFFGISIGIKRRMIDTGKKITFYFLLSEMPLTKVKIKKPGKMHKNKNIKFA
jgi:hypothetical protein